MRKRSLFYILLLVLAGFAVYASDLHSPLFFDDNAFIVNNKFIQEFTWPNIQNWFTKNALAGAERTSDYYRPLSLFSFAVNYAIHGIRPFGYHLVNNSIHLINGILIFWIALFALRRHWMAFLVALIFLIHPAQSEGVAYVSGRGDLLSSFFILAGLIFWIKGTGNKQHILYTFLSVILLILALLSRESAVVFPFLAMVFYVSFISKEKFWPSLKSAFLRVMPHLLIVATYLILRLTVLDFRNFLNFGNVQSLYAEHLYIRLFTFLHVVLEYFRILFYPTNLHERLVFPYHQSFFDWPVWPSFLGLLALLIVLITLYKREANIGKGGLTSPFRIWFFAWGWFFMALSPGSGIIPTNVIIQEHRLYLALLGIFTLFIYYFRIFIDYLKSKNLAFIRVLAIAGLIFYLVFFAWITIKRTIVWGNPVALFEESLRYEPDSLAPLNELGVYYQDKGDFKKAEEYFLTAIEKGARFPQPYYNMGGLRHLFGPQKDLDEAISYYNKAIEIDPSYRRAYRRLAEIYMEKRALPESAYYLRKLNELDPDDVNIHYNLAVVLYLSGSREEALKWVERGLVLTKNNQSAQEAFEGLKAKILFSD